MGEAEVKDNEVYEEDLVDYEEEVENGADGGAAAANASADVVKKGSWGSQLGVRDFLLKPELLRAIQDCGFEHPSEGKLICSSFFPLVAAASVPNLDLLKSK
ncbi:hypothetical protein OsJ_02178 [Oryza sativa Japonica Group]|uniref:DEAD-box RNA helicase Q domain-containing protein n=1 Tax=Oryza sativa subsp. japonica TaxID=39947 RepID=B9EXG8_ORYSJ|nr:hypothetical protein OsJ_02178 [Oryza sativa Japonica Group]